MQTAKPLFSEHRLTRLAAWALAMLAWLAAMLCTDAIAPRRRLRRLRMLERMPRIIEVLLVLRASALVTLPERGRGPARPGNAPAGFARRRPSRPQALRAIVGHDLRRQLRPRGLAARLAVWGQALRHLDAFAAPIAARARRGLTRLSPLVLVRPPHQPAHHVCVACEPVPVDTS